MEEPATANKRSSPLLPDWSQLPEELLEMISENVEDCFDVLHARSVCTSWRSTFPFPSCLLRPVYSLPTFNEHSFETNEEGSWTIEKIPFFLFRVRVPPAESSSEYVMGVIGRCDSDERPSPIQCSVKVEIQGCDPTLINMHDCQILPMGHQYRMFGWNLIDYRGVAFLPLYKEGREGEFVVLLYYFYGNLVMVFTSVEMKWKRLENVPNSLCSNVVTFRGRFYLSFPTRTVVIDPHSLEVTTLMPLAQSQLIYLVPSGDDELFLVEVMVPEFEEVDFNRFMCKVSRLDEEAGKWVEVSDLGDRVLFIKRLGSVCCSANELPDGCGVSGNSILFTNWPENVAFFYKCGRYRRSAQENMRTVWKASGDNLVVILNTSPVVAFRVEH